jgi:glycerophosphoryl diester phosphodiesterase
MDRLVYAHRGSSAAYAENTRAAYLQALADGADGIECDVHLTRDLQVVCHHDPTVDRTSDGTGPVSGYTLAELRRLDVSSWKGVRIPEGYGARTEQLMTLPDLVRMLQEDGRRIGLAVELKHPSPFGRKLEERVLAELLRLGWDPETSLAGNVAITLMSFDPDSVRHLLDTVPGEHLCQLVTDVDPDWIAELVRLGQRGRAAVAQVLARALGEGVRMLDSGRIGLAGPGVAYVRKHPEEVRRWLAAGLDFRVWTVDRDADIDFLVDLGVRQLTSNRPAHVKTRLAVAAPGGRGLACSPSPGRFPS